MSPQVNGVEIRQCRGRPKGSRDKKPRARKSDQLPNPGAIPTHFTVPAALPWPAADPTLHRDALGCDRTSDFPTQGLQLGPASLRTWAVPHSSCIPHDSCPVLLPEAHVPPSATAMRSSPPFPPLTHPLGGADASGGCGGALSAGWPYGGDSDGHWSAFPCAAAAAPEAAALRDGTDPFYGDYPFW